MSDKFYVGLDLMGFENNGIQRPVSRVTLLLDDENVLTAGDDSGLELTANCPHATQPMVNAILSQLKGKTYKMYSASDIKIDPSFELGDGITASGVYSMISRISDDGSGFPGTSAPGKEELEDEYPAGGPMTQLFNRKISETRSSIKKTAEQIRLEVTRIDKDITTLQTSFNVELGKIYSEIIDINGSYSKLEQTIGGFSLSVDNGSESSTIKLIANGAVISSQKIEMNGLVTFKGLSDGTTTIDGGCLKTGTIESVKIKGVDITSSTITGGTVKGGTIEGGTIKGSTLEGGRINGAVVNGGRFITEETHYWENNAYPSYTNSVLITDGKIEFFQNNQDNGEIENYPMDINGIPTGAIRIQVRKSFSVRIYGTGKMLFGADAESIGFGTTDSQTFYPKNNIDMGGFSILHNSDARLKTNIHPPRLRALDVINAIKTYSFDWKESGTHVELGFIAQQLGKVKPDLIRINPSDGRYSTKDLKFIPYLVKAIQELSDEIETMKGEKDHERTA